MLTKSAVKPIYLTLTLVTFVHLGGYMFHDISIANSSHTLLGAFVGPNNISAARGFVKAFIVTSLSFLFLAYALFDIFEDGVAPFDAAHMAPVNTSTGKALRILDLLMRMVGVGIVVFGERYFPLTSYRDAVTLTGTMAVVYAIWMTLLRFSFGVKRGWDSGIAIGLAVVCFSMLPLLQSGDREVAWGLTVLLLLIAATIASGLYAVITLWLEGRAFLGAALDYALNWKI